MPMPYSELMAPDAPLPIRTSVNTAVDTLTEATGLAHRVGELVDRICGALPEPSAGPEATAKAEPMGVLPHLQRRAEWTLSDIARAHRALDRLNEQFQ